MEGTSLAEGDYDLALDQAGNEENRHRARGPAGDWTRLRQYLVGLYWAITTISTVGYGDFVPMTDKETSLRHIGHVHWLWVLRLRSRASC